MFSALKKVGQHQHFNRFDFFYSFIVGQKQGGFCLDRRGELQRVGQADGIACSNKRRSFRRPRVDRRDGKPRERVKRELDLIGQREVFNRQTAF